MALNPKGGRGGKRPGAGRPEGSKNKVTIELRGAAQAYAQDALETLHEVCMNGSSETARVTAACAILDRGYGKPTQQVDVNSDGPRYVVGVDKSFFEDDGSFERTHKLGPAIHVGDIEGAQEAHRLLSSGTR